MQLPTAHRREVIEDLLDIKIFSVMNEALREKVSGLKVKLTDIETKIELGKSKVKLQQGYIETLEQDKEARAKETETLIETAGEEIIKLTSNVTSSTSIVINLKETIEMQSYERRCNDIVLMFEEFFLRASVLKTNPHINNFKEKLLEIEKIIKNVIELVNEWSLFQRNFVYLNSIFCLDEITKSLTLEFKIFTSI
jgi:DNA repair exonuclease SbcCD ATPase subunit